MKLLVPHIFEHQLYQMPSSYLLNYLTIWLNLPAIGGMLDKHCFHTKPVFLLNTHPAVT